MPKGKKASHLFRRTAAVAGVACLAAAALAACSKPALLGTTVTTTAPAPAVAKSAPPSPASATWPLTGVVGKVVNRPAIDVKIENSPDARPQTGLNQADMVWEEIVEGGISRFAAVFNSQYPTNVGPIRSVRPMDGAIAGATRGVIAYSGGKPAFVQLAREAGLQMITESTQANGWTRITQRAAPHNLYGNVQKFAKLADKKHSAAPPQEFVFADAASDATAVTAGQPVTKISLNMAYMAHPRWVWSAPDGVWLRSEGSAKFLDSSGAQIKATNVVAIQVPVTIYPGLKDPAGSSIPYSHVVGSGSGFVASGGSYLKVKWSKKSDTAPVVLTTVDGQSVTLAPGNTWVELVPKGTGKWTTTPSVTASPSAATTGASAPSTTAQ